MVGLLTPVMDRVKPLGSDIVGEKRRSRDRKRGIRGGDKAAVVVGRRRLVACAAGAGKDDVGPIVGQTAGVRRKDTGGGTVGENAVTAGRRGLERPAGTGVAK